MGSGERHQLIANPIEQDSYTSNGKNSGDYDLYTYLIRCRRGQSFRIDGKLALDRRTQGFHPANPAPL